jgi:DMSO/TMAO reductase YedYZ molybdopterin-dependent catalytic subunit
MLRAISNITATKLFTRRSLLKGFGLLAIGHYTDTLNSTYLRPFSSGQHVPPGSCRTDELGNPVTSFAGLVHSTDTELVRQATLLEKREVPLQLTIEGLVRYPKSYLYDELLAGFPQEEKIFRFQSSNGSLRVIPWIGFPLKHLLSEVKPKNNSRFILFTDGYDPSTEHVLQMDEATIDLVFLATGMYGMPLSPSFGGPLRLIVPWKYGFKSVRSVNRVKLVEHLPESDQDAGKSPSRYSLANVNPESPFPAGDAGGEKNSLLPFNGYADKVRHLYNTGRKNLV